MGRRSNMLLCGGILIMLLALVYADPFYAQDDTTGVTATTQNAAKVRVEPNATSEVVGELRADTTVDILHRSYSRAGELGRVRLWLLIPFEDSEGWIEGRTVTVDGDLMTIPLWEPPGLTVTTEQGTWTRFTKGNGLPSHSIDSVAVADDGTVWIYTVEGIAWFDGESWTTLHDISERMIDSWGYHQIAVAPDGAVWATSVPFGAASRFDGDRWTIFGWVDNPQLGLTELDHEVVDLVEVALTDTCLSAVTVAPDGIVWVGTASGFSRYDGETWVHYPYQEKYILGSMQVFALAVAADGSVWIGSPQAITHLDGERRTDYSQEDTGISGWMYGLTVTPDGVVWVAYGGLAWYDGSEWHSFSSLEELGASAAFAVAAAPDGAVWVGTDKGLSRFDGERWTNFPLGDEFDAWWSSTRAIFSLAVAPDGGIWGGTPGGGLFHFVPLQD